jgi:glycosyltransferase involved in cell wall biosynthesis
MLRSRCCRTWAEAEQFAARWTEEIRSPELVAKPVVSVRLITYNHQAFIGEALDSVLMQETDFPYEIVVGDDCSTDGTVEILREYQRRHPARIRLLLASRNLLQASGGVRLNFLRCLWAARGRYVALLDGDDYWVGRDKMRRQVDFLETHPGVVFCGAGNTGGKLRGTNKQWMEASDWVEGYPCLTSTWMIRRPPDWHSLPAFLLHMRVLDTPLAFALHLRGQGYRFREPMVFYRRHAGNYTRPETRLGRHVNHLIVLETVRRECGGRLGDIAAKMSAKVTRELARGILRCCWQGRWGWLWECGRLLHEGWREQWITGALLLRLAGCCLVPLPPGRPPPDPGGSGNAGGKRR